MDDLKIYLEKLLEIIDYQEDKNLFIEGFINLCLQKSFMDYINLLPEERKKEIQAVFQDNTSSSLREKLDPYMATEEYEELFQENTKKLLQDYLGTLIPTLSEEQKSKIDSFFISLKSTEQPNLSV